MTENPPPPDTVDLVRRAQGGDKEALDRLFSRYYPRVRKVVRLRLGADLRGVLESGDILQETFSQAVQALENFEMYAESSFINWLSRIAQRKILEAASFHARNKRDRKRLQSIEPTGSTAGPAEIAGAGESPSQDVAGLEENQRLEACIADLPEAHRESIILRDICGYGFEQLAKETGRPSADAARMFHGSALIELQKLMHRRDSG